MTHHLRLIRTTLVLLFGGLLFGLVAGVIYINQVGFPGRYGDWVKLELAKRQLFLDFDSLRFSLQRGLVATEVRVYPTAEEIQPLLTADELIFDLNPLKALRGEFELREIQLKNGTTHFQAADDLAAIQGHEIESEISLEAGNQLLVRQTSAVVQGIRIHIEADLCYPTPQEETAEDTGEPFPLAKILRPILDELSRWELPGEQPPELSVSIEGDLAEPDDLRTHFTLKAESLRRNDYFLKALEVEGDAYRNLLTLDHIFLKDETGQAKGYADWRADKKEGRFHLSSSLQFQHFLKSCFDLEVAPRLKITSSPEVLVDGRMAQGEGGRFSIHASGQARVGGFSFMDTAYESLNSEFSWQDGDLFLQGLEVQHARGKLDGDVLAQGPQVRYRLRSTLPLEAFDPFLPDVGPTAKAIQDFKFDQNSRIALSLVGTLNRENFKEWANVGRARLLNFGYRSLRVHELETTLRISPKEAKFEKVTVLPDDRLENARLRFKGPASSKVHVDEIVYESSKRKLTIHNLRGKVWPTPIINAFAPKTAANIEKNYRFHEPPKLILNGTFDCRYRQVEQTAFIINLQTTGQTDYPFLKRLLPVTGLRGDIYFRKNKLNIGKLSFQTLDGRASGEVNVTFQPDGKPPNYDGDLKWRDISFKKVSQLYDFKEEEKGALTGTFDFSGTGGSVRKLSGRGFISLRSGNIVSLPVFGPLSPLFAGILGDKRMGYERAKDASASYVIRNGVWQSEDLLAVSTSLNLTGTGWVDLASDKIDMTVRLNARGLLGVITLPLAPIKGLFQFRGTGKFTDSRWASSPFTQPAKGKKDPLFRPPGKAILIQE